MLTQAEQLFDQMEYEGALNAFVMVLQAPNATPIQKARAFLYIGVCFTALGNAENAVQSFMELLKLKPDFRMPDEVSPSVREMFKEALKRMNLTETPPAQPQEPTESVSPRAPQEGKSSSEVTLEATSPKRVLLGNAIEVELALSDPKNEVADLVLSWRIVGGADYSTIRIKRDPKARHIVGLIPGALLGSKAGKLLYYVEAKGKDGKIVGQAGTIDAPMFVMLEEPTKPRSKWVWYALGIGGGLAIAGGIAAAILLTRDSSQPTPNVADMILTIR
jgi:hypothetical protein